MNTDPYRDYLLKEYDRSWDRFLSHQNHSSTLIKWTVPAIGILAAALIFRKNELTGEATVAARCWSVIGLSALFNFVLTTFITNEIRIIACISCLESIERTVNKLHGGTMVMALHYKYLNAVSDWRRRSDVLLWRLPMVGPGLILLVMNWVGLVYVIAQLRTVPIVVAAVILGLFPLFLVILITFGGSALRGRYDALTSERLRSFPIAAPDNGPAASVGP